MSKKICPYCYIKYKISDLCFYCTVCESEFDINELKFSKFEISLSTKVALFKLGTFQKFNYCPKCKKVENNKIDYKCPSCKKKLAEEMIQLDNKVISIVGGTGSGKTIYTLLLMDELIKNITDKEEDNRDLSLATDNNKTLKLIHKLLDEVQDNKKVAPTTPKADKDIDSTAGISLNYTYTNENNKKVLLSFFDSAGEDLQDFEVFSEEYSYITYSSGIIFIMDIFSDKKSLRQTESVLNNLIKFLEKNSTSNINIPIVFVLNKWDLYLKKYLDERDEVWDGTNTESILENIDSISDNIIEHFQESPLSYTPSIFKRCRNRFSNYKFIPVSSLGFDPLSDKNHELKIKPFNIEYPYVYLLNRI